MYKPTQFDIRSFVPPEAWTALKEQSIILMDSRIVRMADELAVRLKEKFGLTLEINTWHTGGNRTQSGFRTNLKVGATYSQHRYGRAVDFIWEPFDAVTAEEIRAFIQSNTTAFDLITRMESNTPTWVHVDCANVDTTGGIQLVKG
jgi:hypothetical protein